MNLKAIGLNIYKFKFRTVELDRLQIYQIEDQGFQIVVEIAVVYFQK